MGACNKTVNPDYWVEGYDEYIASISYGKDSLAMLEVIYKYGYPLTQIVTVDVMATREMSANFPEMDEFKAFVDAVILHRYGIVVTHLKAQYSYDEMFHKVRSAKSTKPENLGKIYGFPIILGAWCNRALKMTPINHYKQKNQFWYIGYAIDEKKAERQEKIRNAYDLRMYPLCNHNLRERECMEICKRLGVLSPVYKTSSRDGCWFCHNQSLEQLRILRKNHPDKWQMLLNWDDESPVRFKPKESVHHLEVRFQLEEQYLLRGESITSKQFYQEYAEKKKSIVSNVWKE